MLIGFRTLIVGLLLVIGPPALDYLGHIDWTLYVGAQWGPVIAGILMIGMRLITTTGVFKK